MQIPVNLDILRLVRDPLQSLSTFYKEVKKLEHFQNLNFCPDFDTKMVQRDQFFGQKPIKLFVEADKCKFLLIWISLGYGGTPCKV